MEDEDKDIKAKEHNDGKNRAQGQAGNVDQIVKLICSSFDHFK